MKQKTVTTTQLLLQGDITDEQRFLDGATAVTIEAVAADDSGWALLALLRVPFGGEAIDEGDLTLTLPDGSDLYATITAGDWLAADTEETAQFSVSATLTGGSGGREQAAGTISIDGERSTDTDDERSTDTDDEASDSGALRLRLTLTLAEPLDDSAGC